MRLHLAKDILMIQEQDVICVSGEPFYSGVSSLYSSVKVYYVKNTGGRGGHEQVYVYMCKYTIYLFFPLAVPFNGDISKYILNMVSVLS